MKKINADFRNCQCGYILYRDFSFSSRWHFDETKKPIGVIIYANPQQNLIKAIALEASEFPLMWSYGFEDRLAALGNKISVAGVLDLDGEENTAAILRNAKVRTKEDLKVGKDYDHIIPAADFCVAYKTPGTQAGDWYLGAIDEMLAIDRDFSTINQGLARCHAELLHHGDIYWTSSEFSYSLARVYIPDDNSPMAPYHTKDKTLLTTTQPLIAIQGMM